MGIHYAATGYPGIRAEPTDHRRHASQALPADRERLDGNTKSGGFSVDARVTRAKQPDPMPASNHSCRLAEDADLLSSPAQGGLGVEYVE